MMGVPGRRRSAGRDVTMHLSLRTQTMVFRHISDDLKERALWLVDNGYISTNVAHLLGVGDRSIRRWRSLQRNCGTVTPLPSRLRGRPLLLTSAARDDIFNLMEEAPDMYIDEILDWLAIAHGIGMSWTALDKHLRDANLTFKHLWKAAAERDEVARQEWRENVQANLLASMVVTVDESSKDNRTIFRSYGRAVSGQRTVLHALFARGQRWSIIAAMAVDGYVAHRIVPGLVDGDEFFEFIVEDVVQSHQL